MKKWILYLLPLLFLLGFIYPTTSVTSPIDDVEIVGNQMVWYTNWIKSHDYDPTYGLPLFWFRVKKSQYPVDKAGNFQYDVYFISQSYYPAESYYGNTPYISSTQLTGVVITANNVPMLNKLQNSIEFWCLFKGDFPSGDGELRATFNYPGNNPYVYIKWKTAVPY